MQRISPFLWFNSQAEEAAEFYTSIFDNSKVLNVVRYGQGGPGPAGSVMTVEFELQGQPFVALNGGPMFKFTEAVSFVVHCESQQEVDYYWQRLLAGGEPSRCGWLKDKFGLSWQIVPVEFLTLIKSEDVERKSRMMAAMMQMIKLDLAALKRAYEGP